MDYLKKLVDSAKDTGVNQASTKKTLVASYGDVKIYKIEGEALLLYTVPVVKPTGPEREIIDTLKEAATRLISISPEEIRDPKLMRDIYTQRVKEIIESSPELGIPKTRFDFYAEMVVREMIGYGYLDPLIHDDKLEEIMVIGAQKPVYVFHRDYDMMKTNIVFSTDSEIYNLISRIAMGVGRRIDKQNPILDARLPDGSRVNATIKPISLNGSTITIRKFREDPLTVVDLINNGTMDSYLAAFLWLAVDGLYSKPANILVSGGTGSGKTTTLNVLASFIPREERVVTIEDTAELKLPIEHIVRFETRPPGLEGTGEISMDALVKNALRMRPDRIIVGEIRHAEAFTLFTAMNTGHQGCMGTVHANDASETVIRLTNPPMSVPKIMLTALDLIVVQSRIRDRRKGTIRRVTELAELTAVSNEGDVHLQTLFSWDPVSDSINHMKINSHYLKELSRYAGMSVDDIELEIEKRKQVLEELTSKGIRDLKTVSTYLNRFEVSNK
ncbi:CpaF family protein [Candidatus Micrarchaeota archaeon]|nr:MAG: CpaF family protein [Candidatus Micrarchaeota archaeon]